jgi:hypothetical protein
VSCGFRSSQRTARHEQGGRFEEGWPAAVTQPPHDLGPVERFRKGLEVGVGEPRPGCPGNRRGRSAGGRRTRRARRCHRPSRAELGAWLPSVVAGCEPKGHSGRRARRGWSVLSRPVNKPGPRRLGDSPRPWSSGVLRTTADDLLTPARTPTLLLLSRFGLRLSVRSFGSFRQVPCQASRRPLPQGHS